MTPSAADEPASPAVSNDILYTRPGRRLRERLILLVYVGVPTIGAAASVYWAYRFGVSRIEITMLTIGYLISMIGSEVGMHRLFSHHAFKPTRSVKIALAIAGCSAVQGTVSYWVSSHRRHHAYSDHPGDPHSPHLFGTSLSGRLRGLWHAHMGWIFQDWRANSARYARDVLGDADLRWIDRNYNLWVFLGLLLPALLGGLLHWHGLGVLSGFLFGGLLRTFLVQQAGYAIASVCHTWGSRPFALSDRSTNNAFMALCTLGAGWHHNHHAFPSAARIGIKPWELDPCGWLIRAFELLGLAKDVHLVSAEAIAARKRKGGKHVGESQDT